MKKGSLTASPTATLLSSAKLPSAWLPRTSRPYKLRTDIARLEGEVEQLKAAMCGGAAEAETHDGMQARLEQTAAEAASYKAQMEKAVALLAQQEACRQEQSDEMAAIREELLTMRRTQTVAHAAHQEMVSKFNGLTRESA